MSHKKVKMTAAAVLASSVLLSGCGLFGGDEQAGSEQDIPKDVSYVDDAVNENGTESDVTGEETDGEDAVTENVQRELYLIDSNGYVVSQTLELPKTNEVAKQALEYLVAGGPVDEMLPNGFRAVLPAGTEVDVNLKEDGTIVADFSNEFMSYDGADEERILQAITWTLTQFENVDNVQIMVNGHLQTVMPVNQTPIGEGVSRANGINYDTADAVDLMSSRAVTLYFMAESNEGDPYYVPVTTRLSLEGKDRYTAIVEALIKGPSHNSGLTNDLSNEIALLDDPVMEDGNLALNFNEAILGLEGRIVSKSIVDSLVLTLTEQTGVESIAITVDGEGDLMATDGTNISEPVARPEKVNTGRF
ncbi:GerMN domain-containing protein [Sutcliffiella horikoshii]|uniref:GerMN domain-containing protein n=1 Tax=Sutcliffiella horikoshii TaxID=79883 RepID=UPI00203E3415|nr:GerMN domain-containing protein [Sutcliffiella horikoshii]MCM3619360.1 GerMN domain-containing protein [Sutcliffiella horikoshii]